MNILARLRVPLVLAVLLGGCAAPPPPPPEPKQELTVTPLSLRPLMPVAATRTTDALAQELVNHYLQGPHYRMSLPLVLAQQYQPLGAAPVSDPRRLMMLYRQGNNWGSLAVTAAQGSIMNAFRVQREGETAYALVFKRVRICLNAGADQPPRWQGGRWMFSQTRPGHFECSGQTRGSLFQLGSGLPGLLGPYVEAGDTVLYGRNWNELRTLATRLVQRFPHLDVPRIQ